MDHTENTFTGVKGLKIFYQAWVPDSPVAVVQVAHGFGEHGGRYLNVANKIVPEGFVVVANDHRGNGKSEGQRNYVDNFDQYVEDQKTFTDTIKTEYPDLPVFLLGHSMGSAIALRYGLKYGSEIKGLVLSGSGTVIGGDISGFVKIIGKVLAKVSPHMTVSAGDLSKFLSHDPAVIDAYNSDPLVFAKKSTARLGIEFMNSLVENVRLASTLQVPLLYQKGSDDKLMVQDKKLADAFNMPDKTLKYYDGLYHEVYNEAEGMREQPLQDLLDWLQTHL
jgi:alpha-beta hydrolase superfamily lysophospholipase